MAAIPEGWFWMGQRDDGPGQQDERPRHQVWVDAFHMALCQVTNRQYSEFLEATGRPAPKFWGEAAFSNPDQPVVGVRWEDAVAFARWKGPGYRLPTEAEWERAARGHRQDQLFPWGDDPATARPRYAERWKEGPEPVATAPPNDFGLYDICENVHEWCLDDYDPEFYRASPDRNPYCRRETGRKSSRGGAWRHHIKIARCAARSSIPPGFAYADYGFRLVQAPFQLEWDQ